MRWVANFQIQITYTLQDYIYIASGTQSVSLIGVLQTHSMVSLFLGILYIHFTYEPVVEHVPSPPSISLVHRLQRFALSDQHHCPLRPTQPPFNAHIPVQIKIQSPI